MDGERLAEALNDVSRGKSLYAYDEQSNRIFVISKEFGNSMMSMEKAFNELKLLSGTMLVLLKEIFMEIVEEKPANDNGHRRVDQAN